MDSALGGISGGCAKGDSSCTVPPHAARARAATGTQMLQNSQMVGVAEVSTDEAPSGTSYGGEGKLVELARKLVATPRNEKHSRHIRHVKADRAPTALLNSMDDLVEETIKGKALPSALISVLQTIMDHMETIINDTSIDHNEDQEEVNASRNAIQDCSDKASLDHTKSGGINDMASLTSSYRSNHSNCRKDQKADLTDKDSKCDDFQLYASGLTPPACAASFPAGPSEATLVCIQQLATWSETTNETYLPLKKNPCDDAILENSRQKNHCDHVQGIFESTFCSYELVLSTACEDQTTCRSQAIQARNTTHANVLLSQNGRKAEHESAKRIQCLLGVLNASVAQRTEKLAHCRAMSVNSSHLNIAFHGIPSAAACSTSPVATKPCDVAWKQAEYTSQTAWYGHTVEHMYVLARPDASTPTELVQPAECVPCASSPAPPPPTTATTTTASADPISFVGMTAVASSTWGSNTASAEVVDAADLDAQNQHTSANWPNINSWFSQNGDAADQWIYINLGAAYDLTKVSLWNYLELGTDTTGRGIQDFDLWTAGAGANLPQGVSTTPFTGSGGTAGWELAASDQKLPQCGFSSPQPVSLAVSVSATSVQYVGIDIKSRWVSPDCCNSGAVGLGQVQVAGTLSPPASR